MTNTQHTPVPWKVEGNRDSGTQEIRIIQASTGGEIAVIYPTLGQAAADIANAVLIAAAPVLLEALQFAQRALNTAPRFRVGDTDSYKIAVIVDNAIATATTNNQLSIINQ